MHLGSVNFIKLFLWFFFLTHFLFSLILPLFRYWSSQTVLYKTKCFIQKRWLKIWVSLEFRCGWVPFFREISISVSLNFFLDTLTFYRDDYSILLILPKHSGSRMGEQGLEAASQCAVFTRSFTGPGFGVVLLLWTPSVPPKSGQYTSVLPFSENKHQFFCYNGVIVNFLCTFDCAKRCPDSWENIFSGCVCKGDPHKRLPFAFAAWVKKMVLTNACGHYPVC